MRHFVVISILECEGASRWRAMGDVERTRMMQTSKALSFVKSSLESSKKCEAL